MQSARAYIRIGFRSKRQMLAIADALRPETTHTGNRARVVLVCNKRDLILRFDGKDSANLRAVMSSYLRMIKASLNTSSALLQLERTGPIPKRDKD
jgi:tRNA threonylcarbamoyladenosine modification (KEOPS) complex  Pcc1 subunit